jgi:predicted Zn-dependent peptidase
MLTIYGGTGSGQLNVLYETIQSTLNTLMDKGITSRELSNSKEQIKGNLMLSLESTNSRMSRNGKNELLLKRHRTLDEILESIEEVTEESVNELGRKLFDTDLSISLVSPDGKLPEAIK